MDSRRVDALQQWWRLYDLLDYGSLNMKPRLIMCIYDGKSYQVVETVAEDFGAFLELVEASLSDWPYRNKLDILDLWTIVPFVLRWNMNFYKLQMDRERDNDILAHYEDDCGMHLTEMVIGRRRRLGWALLFLWPVEGSFPSDYLANDKVGLLFLTNWNGWWKAWIPKSNTFGRSLGKERRRSYQYYIANILKWLTRFAGKVRLYHDQHNNVSSHTYRHQVRWLIG